MAVVEALLQLTAIDRELRELASERRNLLGLENERAALERLLERERARLHELERAGTGGTATSAMIVETERQLASVSRQLLAAPPLARPGEAGQPPSRAALEERRRAIVVKLPKEVATLYAGLVRAGRWPPLAPVKDEYCGACHLKLTAQVINRVRRAEELTCCPHCRRVLYPATPSGRRDA
jgi:predicted  nucleic acid-binding Zn-ribbon protein